MVCFFFIFSIVFNIHLSPAVPAFVGNVNRPDLTGGTARALSMVGRAWINSVQRHPL